MGAILRITIPVILASPATTSDVSVHFGRLS